MATAVMAIPRPQTRGPVIKNVSHMPSVAPIGKKTAPVVEEKHLSEAQAIRVLQKENSKLAEQLRQARAWRSHSVPQDDVPGLSELTAAIRSVAQQNPRNGLAEADALRQQRKKDTEEAESLLHAYEDKLEAVTERAEAAETARDAGVARNAEIYGKYLDYKDQVKELQDNYTRLRAERDALKSGLPPNQIRDAEIKDLQDRVNTLTDRLQTETAQVRIKESLLRQAASDTVKLKEEITELNKQIGEAGHRARQDLTSLANREAEAKNRIKELQTAIDTSAATIDGLQNQIKGQMEALDAARKAATARESEFTKEVKELRNQLLSGAKGGDAIRDKAIADAQRFETEVQRLRAEHANLIAKLDARGTEAATAQTFAGAMKAKIDSLQNQLTEAQRAISDQKTREAKIAQQHTDEIDRIRSAANSRVPSAEAEKLREQVSLLTKDRDEANKRASEIEATANKRYEQLSKEMEAVVKALRERGAAEAKTKNDTNDGSETENDEPEHPRVDDAKEVPNPLGLHVLVNDLPADNSVLVSDGYGLINPISREYDRLALFGNEYVPPYVRKGLHRQREVQTALFRYMRWLVQARVQKKPLPDPEVKLAAGERMYAEWWTPENQRRAVKISDATAKAVAGTHAYKDFVLFYKTGEQSQLIARALVFQKTLEQSKEWMAAKGVAQQEPIAKW